MSRSGLSGRDTLCRAGLREARQPIPVQPFLIGEGWIPVLDGNASARAIFHRHYSYRPYADGRAPALFVGPGEKFVLLWHDARALFVWRRFISGDGQEGVNCAVFRNEGAGLSSELIRAADAIADLRWPGERHYTYVNARKIKSTNPGACFIHAGWRRCGVTKWNKLVILEREAASIDQASQGLNPAAVVRRGSHVAGGALRFTSAPRPKLSRDPRMGDQSAKQRIAAHPPVCLCGVPSHEPPSVRPPQ